MPWINEEDCTGCGVCVETCPVDAITMSGAVARIEMDECIRCGQCHEACPQGAVKHDSERIPREVETNLDRVRGYLEHYSSEEEKQACLKRSRNYFRFLKTVAEKTLDGLENYS